MLRVLTQAESASLRDKLCRRLGVVPGADSLTIEKALKAKQKPITMSNAQSDEFDLLGCFYFADIVPPKRVYVNWGHLDQFDSVSLDVLLNQFDYSGIRRPITSTLSTILRMGALDRL